MTTHLSTCAPILLIGFNRPDYMTAQIEAIRPAHPEKIYIAVDGPRADRPGESELCRQVRECAELVDWPCEVKTLFREKNLGCKYGVSGAISWFFENEPEGIVLEDDCRPTVDFLRFATEMLDRYKDNERVGAICGFSPFNLQTSKQASYHFSRHLDIWGWASWRRVWQHYDVELRQLGGNVDSIIDNTPMTDYYKRMYKGLAKNIANGLSTWDVQFLFLCLGRKLLNIVPKTRLVANVGLYDNRATHTSGYIYWGKDWAAAECLEFPLMHPQDVVCDNEADRLHEKMIGSPFPRILTWLGTKFPRLTNIISAAGKLVEKLLPSLFGK